MTKSDSSVRRAGALGLLAAGAAAALFLAATATGAAAYTPVARWGGAGWVFILAWIITMPVLAPWLRRRGQG